MRLPVRPDARQINGWVLPALSAGAVVVLWALLAGRGAPKIDRWARAWVAAHQDPQVFVTLNVLKDIGQPLYAGPVLLVAAVLVGVLRSDLRVVVVTGLSLLGAALVTVLLQPLVARAGPSGVGPPAVDGAWPSGHAMTASVAALLLARLLAGHSVGRRRAVALGCAAIPAVVDLGLVYCGHHWLTDVVVAAPLSYLVVRVAHLVATVASIEPTDPAPPPAEHSMMTRTAHP